MLIMRKNKPYVICFGFFENDYVIFWWKMSRGTSRSLRSYFKSYLFRKSLNFIVLSLLLIRVFMGSRLVTPRKKSAGLDYLSIYLRNLLILYILYLYSVCLNIKKTKYKSFNGQVDRQRSFHVTRLIPQIAETSCKLLFHHY